MLHQRLPLGADSSLRLRRRSRRIGEQPQALPPSLGIILAQSLRIMDVGLHNTDEVERLGHKPVPTLLPHARD
eukprot:6928011-Pyramimonas_sp.AAC.1